jgi:tetratricopeptide (TPR) repeat protein
MFFPVVNFIPLTTSYVFRNFFLCESGTILFNWLTCTKKRGCMRNRHTILFLCSSFIIFPCILSGQHDAGIESLLGIRSQKIIEGKVLTPVSEPVPLATVAVATSSAYPCPVVQTNNRGEFRVDCNFSNEMDKTRPFTVTLSVSKKGFQLARKMAEISAFSNVSGIGITLRRIQPENPKLMTRAELIRILSARLRQLGPDDGLSVGDQKDYTRGVEEFLSRTNFERAVFLFIKVARNNPSCLRCRTMLALAELAWGDWDDSVRELGESFNALMADRKLARAEPLLAYGVLLTWEGEPAKASGYFAEALRCAPQDALALQEYARAQYLDSNWEAAIESLKQALAAGAGPEMRLMLSEAFLSAGTPDQAEVEITKYMRGRDIRDMPPRVRNLSERIHERKKSEIALQAANVKARARGEEAIDYINHPPQDLPDFEPAGSQAPLEGILSEVGKNVAKLFSDLLNISAVENVQLDKLDREGKVSLSRRFEYLYLCMGAIEKRIPSFDEYRTDSQGHETSQLGLDEGYMLTAGFISAPLIFLPTQQKGSSFRLLGHQKLRGRDTVLIAFAQIPARSRIYGSFKIGENTETTYKQGLAWIVSENYQIVRLASDLLKPLPRIRLDTLKTQIDFDEVRFNQEAGKFWLPLNVIVTVQWSGKVLRNRHAYSDFKLFSVQASQKVEKPKNSKRNIGGPEAPVPQEKPEPEP